MESKLRRIQHRLQCLKNMNEKKIIQVECENFKVFLTFCNQVVNDTHSNSELQKLPQMSCQLVKTRQDCQFLANISLIECNFFRICDEPTIHVTIFAFEFLLLNRQVSSRSSQMSENDTGEKQVHDDNHGSLWTDCRCCSINVNEDIEEWLAGVGVKIRDTFTELINVSSKQLISIGNTIVKVCHFIVSVTPRNIKLVKVQLTYDCKTDGNSLEILFEQIL